MSTPKYPHVVATVALHPKGMGRTLPIGGDFYSPLILINVHYHSCRVCLENKMHEPGETFDAEILFLCPWHVCDFIAVGLAFQLTEGKKEVGTGVITKIIGWEQIDSRWRPWPTTK